MVKKRKIVKYQNGWLDFNDQMPPEERQVLVTNNPAALTAHGDMSHVWISFVIPDGNGYCGFAGDRKIHDIIAWHPMPGLAVEKDK
jgi:hypothetical protein